MKTFVLAAALVSGVVLGAMSAAAQEWAPPGPITMHISFPPGGGTDTQARLIAEELELRHGWTVTPRNTPGRGGLIMAAELKDAATDGTVFGLGVSEALGYSMAAANAGMTPGDFTSIVTTTRTETAFVSPVSKGWTSFDDLAAAATAGETIRVGVISDAMADIAYLMAQANDISFNIVMLPGGRDVLNALYAGDIDAGFLAGLQAQGVQSGDLVELVSAMSRPLSLTPEAPLLNDIGVDFSLDTYFMFFGPAGMSDEARATLATAIAGIVNDEDSRVHELIVQSFGGVETLMGEELDAIVTGGYASASELMEAASQ